MYVKPDCLLQQNSLSLSLVFSNEKKEQAKDLGPLANFTIEGPVAMILLLKATFRRSTWSRVFFKVGQWQHREASQTVDSYRSSVIIWHKFTAQMGGDDCGIVSTRFPQAITKIRNNRLIIWKLKQFQFNWNNELKGKPLGSFRLDCSQMVGVGLGFCGGFWRGQLFKEGPRKKVWIKWFLLQSSD